MRDLRILWTLGADSLGRRQVVRKDLPQEAKEIYRDPLLDLAEQDRRCFEQMVGGQAQRLQRDQATMHYKNIIAIRRKVEDGSGILNRPRPGC